MKNWIANVLENDFQKPYIHKEDWVYKHNYSVKGTPKPLPLIEKPLYAWLIFFASLLLVAVFLWEVYVRFYLECCI